MWKNVKGRMFPQKKLWAGVLRRAAFDYVLYRDDPKWESTWNSAYQFLFEDEHCEDGLTFTEVCGLFGWDPDYVHRLIEQLTREDVQRLESGKFRDEFMVDVQGVVVEGFLHWSHGTVTPILKSRRYIPAIQKHMTVWKTKMSIGKITAPHVCWNAS